MFLEVSLNFCFYREFLVSIVFFVKVLAVLFGEGVLKVIMSEGRRGGERGVE